MYCCVLPLLVASQYADQYALDALTLPLQSVHMNMREGKDSNRREIGSCIQITLFSC